MTYPAFLAEMAAPANRPKLWFGIWTGFAIAIGFGVLATAAAVFDLTPWRWAYVGLVSIKLLTNSLAWWSLIKDRGVMETQGLNTTADVVLLTAAIYFTGGPYSPLLATYVIVIAVLSLLSNLGVTVMMAGLVVVLYAAMVIGMCVGILPPTPVPGAPGAVPSTGYAVTSILYCALVVGVPAWFSAATLRLLRAKEQALELRTQDLINASTQRSQFVASMTHELRTPIHGVQGLADVIAAGVYGPVTDKQRDACASIKRSAQSLLGLVDDVLNLARAEAN
ncbi:MAG TPA: histidine kinase dimerization/phospho-acceptor domain-containing protein, partial [Kofleriaceae bacterium]